MLTKIRSFRIKHYSAKATWYLIDRLRRRNPFKWLFTLAVVEAGKRIQKSYIRTIESACPQKDEDAEHIATLRWTLEHMEKIGRGDLTLEEFEHIYEEREDDDAALDAEVSLNDRLEELGAFKKSILQHLLYG